MSNNYKTKEKKENHRTYLNIENIPEAWESKHREDNHTP